MKAFIVLALLAVVSAQRRFYQTPNLVPAESNAKFGQHLRRLNELREFLGLPEEFSLQAESYRKSSSGVRRVRLRQHYKGLPIRVATLQASQNENGFYTGSVTGFCPTIGSDFDTSPHQSRSDLENALVKYINENDEGVPPPPIEVSELENFQSQKQIHLDDNGNPVVAYFVTALVERGLDDGAYIRYPRVLFDANDLSVIHAMLPVQRAKEHCHKNDKTTCSRSRGGNRKSPGPRYGPGCNQVCLNAAVKEGNICVFENERINVKTLQQSWKRSEAKLVQFKCGRKLRDGKNGASSPASDAFYYGQIFYDVLENWGRLESTNREPHTLFVHFGDGYPNSFWDGRSTTFGDGTPAHFPYAIAEVIGHEMCHAVTDSFGNLIFDAEAAAINEAFSDFCGKAITYYLEGEAAGWEFAKALVKNRRESLRYFDNPARDGRSIAHISQFDPAASPYTTMGIYLRAFYGIVAEHGVRFRDAFETFVFANQIYWNEETGLIDGACGALRAAVDLGLNPGPFKSAFQDVGIDLRFCELDANIDHIVACDRNINGELRWAEVNAYRSAKYIIKADYSKQYVRVTVSGAGDNTVLLESHCSLGITSAKDRSALFPLGAYGAQLSISAASVDLVEMKIRFEFE